MANFTWDAKAARYRDERGSFVSTKTVIGHAQGRIDSSERRLENYMAAIASGQGNIDDFQNAAMQELKNQHIQSMMLGRGGKEAMTPADYGRLGATLKQEYKFMRRFVQEAAAGNLSDKQIANRLKMYGNASWKSFQLGELSSKVAAGFTHKRRVLSDVENCVDCIRFEAIGWVPIASKVLPPPGTDSECKSNCRCRFDYKIDGKAASQTKPDIDPLKPNHPKNPIDPGTLYYDRAKGLSAEAVNQFDFAPDGDPIMGRMFDMMGYDEQNDYKPFYVREKIDAVYSDLQYEIYKIGKSTPYPGDIEKARINAAAALGAYDQSNMKINIKDRRRLQRLAYGSTDEALAEMDKIKDNRMRTRGRGDGKDRTNRFLTAAEIDGAKQLRENRLAGVPWWEH